MRHAHGQESARSWATSHLAPLELQGKLALVDIMASWYHGRQWLAPDESALHIYWEYVDRHGLGGCLGALAIQGQAMACGLAEKATKRYFSNLLYFEQVRLCCLKIQNLATQSGLPFFFVKGPALAGANYRDEGIRSFSDIDIFVSSRADALLLLSQSELEIAKDGDVDSIVASIRDPGRIITYLDGWEIEVRYPPASGPVADLFERGSFPAVHNTAAGLAIPDCNWHFLFLLQHMAVNHLFSRLIWFLDLAVLYRSTADCIDPDWLANKVEDLQLANAAAAASQFCRQYIDPRFPELPARQKSWNLQFLKHLTEVNSVVAGHFSHTHEGFGASAVAFLYAAVSSFLLTDPPQNGLPWQGRGGQWISQRLISACQGSLLIRQWICRVLVLQLILPALWIVARLLSIRIFKGKTRE